jgi:hypothetical protein
MKLHWPPPPLGLGPPLNIMLLSAETRPQLARTWWIGPLTGLATAALMAGSDFLLFGGATIHATPSYAEEGLSTRVLIAIFGSLSEELVVRAGIATLVAWGAYKILRDRTANPVRLAQWIGVLAGAAFLAWAHVGQVEEANRFWRIMTFNGIGNVAYGWLYWSRGFETALLAHMTVTTALYIVVPALGLA